jgi:UDP-2-acetamido-2,6-beta-L-arabino-hexul-4-ose reductase
MNILVTGSDGFIAKNLIMHLSHNSKYNILTINKKSSEHELYNKLIISDVVFHLAGVNKEIYPKYTYENNYSFIKKICFFLENNFKKTKIFYASSTQVKLNNPYGKSKLKAEKILLDYKKNTGAQVFIYRLPNIFGKWSKPHYNSAVATFCHQVCKRRKMIITNPKKKISLLYIDDLIFNFLEAIEFKKNSNSFVKIERVFPITLKNLINIIKSFDNKEKTYLPNNISNSLIKNLYSTYVSFFSKKDFTYKLNKFSDNRGYFSEFLKNLNFGQVSFFSILPKKKRGNHYHHSKIEKFVVISGKVRFNFINILTKKRFSILTDENANLVVNTIPGWAHNIENKGNKVAKILVWANEILDKKKPDTIFYKV